MTLIPTGFCSSAAPILDPNAVDYREIDILPGKSIKVTKTETPSKVTYTIDYESYVASKLSVTVTPKYIELGDSVVVNYTANLTVGTEDIVSNTVTPLPSGLVISESMAWQDTISSSVSGPVNPVTWQVIDAEGNTSAVTIQAVATSKLYIGYSANDVLTEAQVKALTEFSALGTSIKTAANSIASYNFTASTAYIYWIYPVGGPGITSAEEGPLPVPLTTLGSTVSITNDHGVTISYKVVRTSVKSKYIAANIKLI